MIVFNPYGYVKDSLAGVIDVKKNFTNISHKFPGFPMISSFSNLIDDKLKSYDL